MGTGSVTIIGTGIKLVAHASIEACAHIEQADKVYYVAAEPACGAWIHSLNYRAESLQPLLREGRPRHEAYERMVERILGSARRGLRVCAVFYGHPAVFVHPSHELLHRARAERLRAEVLPAISAVDCLFADLSLDPGRNGCQMFEATEFLVYGRTPDPCSALLLLQVGLVGVLEHTARAPSRRGLRVLSAALRRHYGARHECILYEAAQYTVCEPLIERVRISALPKARVSALSTLYVPPRSRPRPDRRVMRRLGMSALRRLPRVASSVEG